MGAFDGSRTQNLHITSSRALTAWVLCIFIDKSDTWYEVSKVYTIIHIPYKVKTAQG